MNADATASLIVTGIYLLGIVCFFSIIALIYNELKKANKLKEKEIEKLDIIEKEIRMLQMINSNPNSRPNYYNNSSYYPNNNNNRP